MKTNLISLLSTLLLPALGVCGQGTMIYDQSSATNRAFASGYGIQQSQPIGQSFTPTLSSVGFVQLELDDFNSGNGVGATVYVNLRAESITGPVLGTTDPVFMPDGFAYGITNFFFSTPAAVTPGTTYYFQPVVQSGDHWDLIAGAFDYPGGTFFWSGAPDPSGNDAWFREGVVIPEPSAGVLLLLGGGGFLAIWRVRKRGAGAY
jgi:hypothetical protein